jgi:hypothetical protein
MVEQLADRQAVAEYQAMMAGQGQFAQEDSGLHTAVLTEETVVQVFEALQTFEVQGNLAVARVTLYTEHEELAYRQTRFYGRSAEGWLRTAPDAALWGPARSLETPYFIFRFRQNDAQAVAAVAYEVDELYTTLRRNVGLPITPAGLPLFNGEKLVIDVNLTQSSAYAATWFGAPDRIRVPSPALSLVPAELTNAELLAQSIALPLLAQVLTQASERYQSRTSWRPLLDGLRLWQVWDLDLPLAVWRKEVVTWLYGGLPATHPGQAVVLPERYTALCAAHKLWMTSPVQLNIPLMCAERVWEDGFLAQWVSHAPPTRLDQLAAPVRPGEFMAQPGDQFPPHYPGHTVALATLVEYIVAAYGRERLPVLVAGLGQYESWDTLLPPVFGVSAAEFEAGWQAYLAAHYR